MIAKAAHTPYAAIHGFANGGRDIKPQTADKLAKSFGDIVHGSQTCHAR